MLDRSVVTSVQKYLQALEGHGIPVKFGVVFGSQATVRTHKWSDIDLLVVSPQLEPPRKRSDIDLLWILAGRIDSRIEPIPCGERQWREDDSSAIVEIARREGERVEMAEVA